MKESEKVNEESTQELVGRRIRTLYKYKRQPVIHYIIKDEEKVLAHNTRANRSTRTLT